MTIPFAFAAAPDATPESLRTAFAAAAKEALAKARVEGEEVLRREGGFACARFLSGAQDAVIIALYNLAREKLYRADNPSTGERIAILAVGGYGRGTLAPGSDTDILFLLPMATPWGESIAEAMLYALWDIGLKVGHATRTVDECIRVGREDLTVRTALLEARLIAGDAELFATFDKRFDAEVVAGRSLEFVKAKLAERDERIMRAGQSRYLVEPNVKEGKGGFRDLQTLYWIAKYAYRIKNPWQLVEKGVFTAREMQLFERCEEFLWRVRCHMHYATGRAEERLNFELQRTIAKRMGYSDTRPQSAVERFMKHYFLIAKDVGDLSAILSAALEASHQKARPMLDRFMGRFRRRPKVLAGTRDFVLENDRISVRDKSVFAADPVNLIRLFWYADHDQLAIHPHATRLVTLSLKLIDEKLRHDAEANRLFLDILTSRRSSEVVLRLMHETGVLGRFIPDFGRISAMMQFSMYHHYTVDEHTLRCIGNLAALERGELEAELPVAHRLMPNLTNRRALYVALFLHDIGKGRSEAHEIVGARIAEKLCPRLGLDAQETELVVWLVRDHLVMSQTAQSRDIADPRTIATFCAQVQTIERLRLLHILTVCDIRGVGPGVWNGWKGQLMRALYRETEANLSGGHAEIGRKERIAEAQKRLAEKLPEWNEAKFTAYAQRHNPAYWLKVGLTQQLEHARLMERAQETGDRFQVHTATDAFRGVTEITLTALDHPRLLSILTGACAAAGANIAEAQIFTTNDGFALDTLHITRAFAQDDDELRRADRVAKHIIATLKGEVRLPEIVALRKAQSNVPGAFEVPPSVMIDNHLSERSSVIEMSGLDRPGLLYELTTELGKQNLNIASARIVTYGEKAVDVFYVTDLTGSKITEPSRINRLKGALLGVLAGPDKDKSRGAA